MTLLVLELRIPAVEIVELPEALSEMLPVLAAYFISFAMLGVIWVAHRSQFKSISRTDHNFHYITILFLACVALVPFTSSILAKYYQYTWGPVIFGIIPVILSLLLYTLWVYATKDNRLVGKNTPASLVRMGKVSFLFSSAGYTIAIIIAFINPVVSLIIFAILPALFVLPLKDIFWMPIANR